MSSRTRPVLITTAIVVHVPDGGDDFTAAEPYGDRLRDAIAKAFDGAPEVEYPDVLSFVRLDDPEMNAGKCERCGCWCSDYTMPDELEGLPFGRRVDGLFLCDECEVFGGSDSST